MFLSIATTHQPATDLGFLLHKHPDRLQQIELTFGKDPQLRRLAQEIVTDQ